MKVTCSAACILLTICATLLAPGNAHAGTNGFIVPTFRGSAITEFGYWESFVVPSGAPGNPPDRPGTTTGAVLTQSDSNAIVTGSGNIYNQSAVSFFALADSTPFTLATVVLQIRTIGSELDYNSVSLAYSNASGSHSIAPLFRYELNRATVPGQGSSVSSLWQWDLTGLEITNYDISFNAAAESLSFDSMTLDTADHFIKAFPEEPFKLQSTPANLARWMYPFNGAPADRPTASVFGSLGSGQPFDSRDAQYLLGWNTTNRIPAGLGAENYLIRRARVTLTISSGSYVYTGTLRDYRTYLPTNDANYLPPAITNSPVELFGAGFRGEFTNSENAVVSWAATNYPQDGPFYANPPALDVYSTNRVAYAAGFDTNGVLVDVSNNINDDGTNELVNPFEVAPFAVGQTTNIAPGEPMSIGNTMTFDLNLDDPLIYGYVQNGLNVGNLSLIATSLTPASRIGPVVTYPNFYTIFSAIATSSQFPLLDIEGEIVRANVDGDGDGLPDDWENFYFGSLINGATTDVDADGVNNLAEYRAGTRPTAGSDWLHLFSLQKQDTASELHFTYAPGREYSIRWSDDLQTWQTFTNAPLVYSSAWLTKAGTNLVYPSPVYAVWHDTNATSPQRFYRVGAQ